MVKEERLIVKCKSKKRKRQDGKKMSMVELDGLPWKSSVDVTIGAQDGEFDHGDDGFTMLEEVDGVDVIYDDDGCGGKVVKFKKFETLKKIAKIKQEKSGAKTIKSDLDLTATNVTNVEFDVDMSAWDHFNLHPLLMKALAEMKYQIPTEIQSKVLAVAVHKNRDIIGAAETGSGKTLAFGLPILHKLLTEERTVDGLPALILSPTRELAMQIKDHLQAVAKFTKLNIMAILGGMSIEKQKRVLMRKPDLIIATPGRFWQWISEEDSDGYLNHLHASCRFLVLDEADRMIEKGHFQELTNILLKFEKPKLINEWSETDFAPAEETMEEAVKTERQTFIFSATLIMKKVFLKESSPLESLMKRIPMRDKDPCIVDVTSSHLMARTLTETRIECLQTEKDLYLYYFLLKYPGRTIVFVNSIDCIKRVLNILSLLKVPAYGLHAHMQQRQRLKNLDRFKVSENCALIASDVASRGLDIPSVDHVIHYQLPRTNDLYVHRSGRTARANKDGLSILFCSPEEVKYYKMICKSLAKDQGVPMFDVDRSLINAMKKRVNLAREISGIVHTVKKKRDSDRWLAKFAEELDDVEAGGDDDEDGAECKKKSNNLKRQLDDLLNKPIIPVGFGSSFITGKNTAMVKRLLNNTTDSLPTVKKSNALKDVGKVK